MKTKEHNQLSVEEIELLPDGEERFRAAIHAAAKSGPKHRTKETEPKRSIVKESGKP